MAKIELPKLDGKSKPKKISQKQIDRAWRKIAAYCKTIERAHKNAAHSTLVFKGKRHILIVSHVSA